MKTRKVASAASLVLAASLIWSGIARSEEGHQSHEKHSARLGQHAGEVRHQSHPNCELHGGQVTMTERHHFETVLASDGIRVYEYSGLEVPIRTGDATGDVTLKFKDGTEKKVALVRSKPRDGETTAYFCPGHPDATQMNPGTCQSCGSMQLQRQDYLFGAVDLSNIEPGSVRAEVHITNMLGPEPEVSFIETRLPWPKGHEATRQTSNRSHTESDSEEHHH